MTYLNNTYIASAVPTDKCCDICNPSLFNRVRPAKTCGGTTYSSNQTMPSRKLSLRSLVRMAPLYKRELYPLAMWGPQAILDSANCELLSSVGPIETIETLSSLLKNNWARWDVLGGRLFECSQHSTSQNCYSTQAHLIKTYCRVGRAGKQGNRA